MEDVRVGKVAAVCIRRSRGEAEVLVFEHPLDDGTVMLELPAGTIEADEAPEAAAERELAEETGVRAGPPVLAGIRDEEWEGESRRRWVYLCDAPEGLQDEWPYTCDCGVPIRVHWLPFREAMLVESQQPWLEMARERFYAGQTSHGSFV